MLKNYYKTAESVSPGHPDSYMDYIANSILDEYLKEDEFARVAIDGVVKNKYITFGGEITSTAKVDIPSIIKRCTKEIGYDFEPVTTLHIYEQSPEINLGTNDNVGGAGDQGTITGYACNDNENMMPLEKVLADEIIRKMFFEIRPNNNLIKSDMKSQVTIYYDDKGIPYIDTVVFACQHSKNATQEDIRNIVINVCEEVFSNYKITNDPNNDINYIINGTGQFLVGGPEADSGEVGRKIVVDAYGVSIPVGGGTYNGKDPTKVDRSAAYMARYVAKHIVAANLASICLITVSYCIGKKIPISINYDFKGTNTIDSEKIIKAANNIFSFEPQEIIKQLKLRNPIYATSGLVSHFGKVIKNGFDNEKIIVPWEELNKVEDLINYLDKLN